MVRGHFGEKGTDDSDEGDDYPVEDVGEDQDNRGHDGCQCCFSDREIRPESSIRFRNRWS